MLQVKLKLDNDVVVASWDVPKDDRSGEAITGYKVRAEDDDEGNEGILLCEVRTGAFGEPCSAGNRMIYAVLK